MYRALGAAVDVAERLPGGQRILGEALCAGLDTVAAGAPGYAAFNEARNDALMWAEISTPVELEIYLSVILRRLAALNKGGLAMRARKRVFMDLWNAMIAADQKAFLKKVREGQKSRPRAG
jgi:hypothetical protein